MAKSKPRRLYQRNLTQFEIQILTVIAQGYSNAEAAAVLKLKETSITSALAKARRKLDARTTTQAVIIALRRRLI